MPDSKVWSHFSVKKQDGTVLNFRIENMADEKLDTVIKLLMNHFITEETLHRGSGITKNPEAMKERLYFYEYLKQKPHQIAICVSEDGTESESVVVGASVTFIATKEDPCNYAESNFQTNEMKKFLEIIRNLKAKFNVFEKYGLDRVYDDKGIVVHPKYRGLGIAQELFRVRRLTCKEHKVPMTVSWMTTFGSQKAAKRDGWETVYELDCEEFGREMGVVFENAPTNYVLMISRG